MDSSEERVGSLEKHGIEVQTLIDEDILTETAAKKVRFRATKVKGYPKPIGYAFSEVDVFVQDIVIPSLAWYQSKLHERDRTIHMLGGELDKAETDIINLRNQIQYIEYNGAISKGIAAGEDDKEMAALLVRLQEKESQVESLKQALQSNGIANPDSTTIADYEKAINERDAYIEEMTTRYTELYESYEALSNTNNENSGQESALQIVALQTENDNLQKQLDEALLKSSAIQESPDTASQIQELNDYIETVTSQYTELLERYNTDTAALQQQLENAVANQSSGGDNSQEIQELNTYIETITNQYNELLEQYNQLSESNLSVSSDSNIDVSAYENQIVELNNYIETVTEQYNALLAQYEELNTENEQLRLTVSAGIQSDNNAELGELRVQLEAERAKNARLEAELAEYTGEDEEEPEKALPLLTDLKDEDYKNTNIDIRNLPPGIKPSDLI